MSLTWLVLSDRPAKKLLLVTDSTIHLILKMISAQVVKKSATNNSFFFRSTLSTFTQDELLILLNCTKVLLHWRTVVVLHVISTVSLPLQTLDFEQQKHLPKLFHGTMLREGVRLCWHLVLWFPTQKTIYYYYYYFSASVVTNLTKMWTTLNTNRDSSNNVLDISTDDSFCKSFTKCPIVPLVDNKPVLNDFILLQAKVTTHQQLISEVWSVLCLFMYFVLEFST